MPTWSSTSLRLHALSHGAGHTRPSTAGKGFASVSRRHAYSCHATPCGGFSVPRAIASQPRMSSPAGQPAWHGGADWMYVGHLCDHEDLKIASRKDPGLLSPSRKRRNVSLRTWVSPESMVVTECPFWLVSRLYCFAPSRMAALTSWWTPPTRPRSKP